MPEPTEALQTILSLIEQIRGGAKDGGANKVGGEESADRFAETLRHRRIPHVSFSQVSTVEFCHFRYFLEYVALLEPSPVPDYFTKGKLLHQVIAAYYDQAKRDPAPDPDEFYQVIDRAYPGDHHEQSRSHLRNAFTVHLQNRWQDCEVMAVEQPFAMQVDPALPPLVGVIDLVMQKDGRVILVDHKTGRDFYADDELQMAIYVEYIRQRYGDVPCEFYYDHYRWVNNLSRVRKPAFQRTRAFASGAGWPGALSRIRSGVEVMEGIREKKWAEKNGECFRCPYRKVCW